MERKVTKSLKLGERYAKNVLNSGHTVLAYPMEQFKTSAAVVVTKFGSKDLKFKKKDSSKLVTVSEGAAHFLEHKMFENAEGVDFFKEFSKVGASVNAFTSFNCTAYYFFCVDGFLESLAMLLDLVQNPYFTEKNVEKERGIIEQESRMLLDNPSWIATFNCLKGLFKKNPINCNIEGSLKTIAKISKEELYECYDYFYTASNMAVILVGGFDEDLALKVINSGIKVGPKFETERFDWEEPEEIVQSRCFANLPVLVPHFCIGYKLKPYNNIDKRLKAEVAFKIIGEILFGEGSKLNEKLHNSGLVSVEGIKTEIISCWDCFAVLFSGMSTNSEAVLEEISLAIEKLLNKGVNQGEFDMAKRVVYGSEVYGFNSVDGVVKLAIDSIVEGYGLFSVMGVISNFKVADLEEYIKELREDRVCLSQVKHEKAES